MKSRLSLVFATLVVLLGSMLWVIQDRRNAASLPAMAAVPSAPIRTEATPAAAVLPESAIPVAPTQSVSIPVAIPTTEAPSLPMVHVDPSGEVKYLARDGDTVSQLAAALLGSDTKEHRDAVIAANPSLQSNPDRVLAGYNYSITPSPLQPVVQPALQPCDEKHDTAPVAAPAVPTVAVTATKSDNTAAPKMKYVAQPGDTVRGLAGNLLGADTKANRESIIAGNASLQENPDHLVAGKSYTIVAPNGLAADTTRTLAKAPTTQPDADDVLVSAGRNLRYTAKAGDTVSKLALVLLGSDTATNRETIINSNPSLKQDPDHLVAGQTYWIAAPSADVTR